MSAPRGDRGGERKRRQHFYICQDYCISEARRLFGFTLPREDFRELDSHGRDEHIGAIVGTYDNYGCDWSDLCAQVPELAAAVPVSKGGQKGKGKGRQPTLANPAAKPKAAPIAKQGAAEPAAATGSRDARGTPPQARTESLGGIRAPTSASSSGGPPVAAPVAEGAAPSAEPKEKPPAAVASEQPTLESVAPDAQPTAADVLPKEELELDDLVVKEEPAEEAQAEAPAEEVAEPAAEGETVEEEAPDFDGGAADAEIAEPEAEAAEEEGPAPIDVDEEAVVHSSPVAEVVSVQSPASPDLSERAFSEPPERPEREGRLRVRPRILKPPSDLPPGTYPTVRVDRQGIWVLVSPAPAPPTSGVRDAEEVRPAPIAGAADLDPYELPQAVWQDLAQAYAARPPSLDLASAPVVSSVLG